MAAPSVFCAETVLNAPVEVIHAFHENPLNIGAISPGWQRVKILYANPVAVAGEKFSLQIVFLGLLPMRWEGVWREATRPGLLVDEMLRGPFAHFVHRHEFEAIDADHTRMTDHVTYRFFGGWLGRIFGETLGRWQFRLMFADRHARTRRWAREQRG